MSFGTPGSLPKGAFLVFGSPGSPPKGSFLVFGTPGSSHGDWLLRFTQVPVPVTTDYHQYSTFSIFTVLW